MKVCVMMIFSADAGIDQHWSSTHLVALHLDMCYWVLGIVAAKKIALREREHTHHMRNELQLRLMRYYRRGHKDASMRQLLTSNGRNHAAGGPSGPAVALFRLLEPCSDHHRSKVLFSRNSQATPFRATSKSSLYACLDMSQCMQPCMQCTTCTSQIHTSSGLSALFLSTAVLLSS